MKTLTLETVAKRLNEIIKQDPHYANLPLHIRVWHEIPDKRRSDGVRREMQWAAVKSVLHGPVTQSGRFDTNDPYQFMELWADALDTKAKG